MKISWGWGVTLLYSSFVVMMSSLAYLSFNQDINLVKKDYYSQELKFQEQIDKMNNSETLLNKVDITYNYTNQILIVSFPDSLQVDGEILLYRPSDATLDKKIKIETNKENKVNITTAAMLKGLWKIQIDWSANEKSFYDQKTIII